MADDNHDEVPKITKTHQVAAHLPSSVGAFKIEPLTDKNWHAWKRRMLSMLRTYGVHDYVVGKKVRPESGTPDEMREWETNDGITQTLILMSVSDEQTIHFAQEEDTAENMWSALQRIHEKKGPQSRLAHMRALFTTRADDDTNIPIHLHKLRDLQQ